MKKFFLVLLLLNFSLTFSQSMTNTKLNTLFNSVSDTIVGKSGRWQLKIKNTTLICITDSINNRLRIISPIVESNRLTEDLKTNALLANFHTALDVKYAISDNILWSAFIHPLKELTEKQVIDAVKQVYSANITFGSSYSSTTLVFPGRKQEEIERKDIDQDINIRQKI